MKYLKLFEDHELYDYKKDPVISDLISLSLDLIDMNFTLLVDTSSYSGSTLGYVEFNHNKFTGSSLEYEWPSAYKFYYHYDGDWMDRRLNVEFKDMVYNYIQEVKSIIKEMHPDINIEVK